MNSVSASRMLRRDVLAMGMLGLTARRTRAALSAIGVAIGIASMVAVLGISESSKAGLLAQIDRLGTNLLTVTPGQNVVGGDAKLPERAAAMIRRREEAETVAATETLDASVRRTDKIPVADTGGLAVTASDVALLRTLSARVAKGRWLDGALARQPTIVLGAAAAQRLGITKPGANVWIDGRWFTVVGILEPVALDPSLDRAAFVAQDAAERLLGAEGSATAVYVRAKQDAVGSLRPQLRRIANPERPEEVQASRPSDALEARVAAKGAFTGLFLGLGAVALLVGAVGIANVMVISVLERRGEIGLRRALGASERHIAGQFLAEAVLLAALGGVAGSLLGAAITAGYGSAEGTAVVVPAAALAGGVGSALLVGAVAGLYPALRAARLAPTDALRAA